MSQVAAEPTDSAEEGRWIHCGLIDTCNSIDYGLTASASDSPTGVKFLRITDIVSGQVNWDTVPYAEASEEVYKKYKLRDGDIVIARTGASTGASAYIQDPPRAVFASYLVRLNVKPEYDSRFISYYLKSSNFWAFMQGVLGDKSAQPNASASTMGKAPVRMPKLKTDQRRIAHILGTLDDKIELNRRMNATLEGMARALFKSWFVDFEPVRAKMEGRWRRGESLPGMPAEMYNLFPERLSPSELGDVPEGWEVGVLDDSIELLSGGTPRTSVAEYWNGDIPWYTAKDAPSPSDVFVVDTERKITQEGIDNSATKMLPARTTIISARGTVGRLACLGIPMTMNQTCYGIRGVNGYPDYFTYWNVRMAVDELQQRTHGTIFDTITRQTFKLVDTTLPSVALACEFEKAILPTMGRMLGNLHESQSLAVLRDALLPELVSGEVGV